MLVDFCLFVAQVLIEEMSQSRRLLPILELANKSKESVPARMGGRAKVIRTPEPASHAASKAITPRDSTSMSSDDVSEKVWSEEVWFVGIIRCPHPCQLQCRMYR